MLSVSHLLAVSVLALGIGAVAPEPLSNHTAMNAAQRTAGMFSIGDFYDHCVDRGIQGGACRNYDQFSVVDTNTLEYWHRPLNNRWDRNCTAGFFGLPEEYYVLYQTEDRQYRDGTGEVRIEQVCWLRISTQLIPMPS